MRILETQLAPQSDIGRVVLGVLVAVLATVALLAWSPANACDSSIGPWHAITVATPLAGET
jgi:hypothetical protein